MCLLRDGGPFGSSIWWTAPVLEMPAAPWPADRFEDRVLVFLFLPNIPTRIYVSAEHPCLSSSKGRRSYDAA